jgi:hypothetical protein
MEVQDLYRDQVLSRIVGNMPETFWRRLVELAQRAYPETYSAVTTDPELVVDQRPQKLFQDRYFKMESVLMTAAREAGVPASSKLVGSNRCYYCYASIGGVGTTQSYVPVSGEMPTPAAFRRQLAEMTQFEREPRLDLGDESTSILMPTVVSGIVLHSPTGRAFTAAQQMLGAIGFFVPYRDYSGWAVELPLLEIISAYKPQDKREDRAAPKRKKIGKTGTEE